MAVIATGFFDGVHPGHRLVIDTLLSEARARGEQSVVVTFWPHPRAVLQSDADELRYLTSRAEKDAILRGMGVDAVETVPFTREFAGLSAGEYLQMLKSRFGCTCLVLGYDTRFGYEQAGPEQIAELAARMGLDAVTVPPVYVGHVPVSSSRIREALEAGDVAQAARLLGRPYRLHGVVVSGNRLGRTIGFPTANMKLYEPLMCVPKNGVYATGVTATGVECRQGEFRKTMGARAHVNGRGPLDLVKGQWEGWSEAEVFRSSPCGTERPSLLRGMTNIGVRPTVSEREALTIETYIFDFDEMIYGLDITVEFKGRIRDERKFASLEELKLQLQADATLIRRENNP